VTALLVVASKDLRLLLRDRGALLFTLLIPVLVVTIVAASLHGTDASVSIQLPVVDEDRGPVAGALIEALTHHLKVEEVDRPTAESLVSARKQAAAALVLPERMSKSYLANRPSTLLLLTDPAKGSEVATVKALLLVAQRDAEALADPLHEDLLLLEERNLTGSRLTTTSFEQNIPGFSVMFVLMATLFGVAFALDDERRMATLTRLRVAPVHPASFLGGKLLARFVLALVQIWLLFAVGATVFGLRLGPSLATFALLTVCVVFAVLGFGFLTAGFMRSREQIIPIGLSVVMITCAIGGCWWPLYLEPPWLQQAAHLFVTAWAMEGLQDLILRESALARVWPTFLALIAYGGACLVVGGWLQRRAMR